MGWPGNYLRLGVGRGAITASLFIQNTVKHIYRKSNQLHGEWALVTSVQTGPKCPGPCIGSYWLSTESDGWRGRLVLSDSHDFSVSGRAGEKVLLVLVLFMFSVSGGIRWQGCHAMQTTHSIENKPIESQSQIESNLWWPPVLTLNYMYVCMYTCCPDSHMTLYYHLTINIYYIFNY